MENTIRVAKYLRVSTADQAEQYSLHAQNRILTSYIEANKDLGWETSESLNYIDDGITGASKADDRPALSRLKKDILDKKIDVILIYRLDRLFRKVEFLLNFITFLRENSINLISKSENIDINTHSGNLMITMLGAIGELERSTIQERTMEGKISKAMQGYFVNGMVPFGYSKESDGKGNKLIVNKEEAEIVKKIYKMYLEDGGTIMGIRQFINSLGIGTRYDKSGKEKLTKNFIHYSFVNKILRNEVYTGRYPFNKGKTGCRNGIKEKEGIDKTKWLYLDCPQIIDSKIFEKVQEKIGKGKVMNGKGEKHILTGLLTCGHCGKSLVYYKSKKGTGNYRCTGRNKTKGAGLCDNPQVSELKMLDILWNKAKKIFEYPDEFIKMYIEEKENNDSEIRYYKKELIDIETALLMKDKIINNGLRKQLEDDEHYDNYKTIIKQATEEKLELIQKKKTVEEKLKNMKTIEEIKNMIIRLSEMYIKRFGKFDKSEKTEYIKELIQRIDIFKEKYVINYTFNI